MREALPLVYLVARREFLTRIRSRFYQVSTVLAIVLLSGYIVLQATVLNKAFNTSRVGFVGATQAYAAPLQAALKATGGNLEATNLDSVQQGVDEVNAGKLDAVVSGDAAAPTVTVRDKLDPTLEAVFDGILQRAALNRALAQSGLDPTAIDSRIAAAKVDVTTTDPGAAERNGRLVEGLFVAILLYSSLLMYGQFVAQGVVEEKANRIVELLLSAISPRVLLFGKVIGIGLVGMLQMTLIGLSSLVVVHFTNDVNIPPVEVSTIIGGLVAFVLGFVFYALLFAAAASLVTRQEDVAAATAPITVVVIGTYLAFFWVIAHPQSPLAVLISILPGFAPIIMPTRLATGDAQAWELVVAVVLSVAAIFALNAGAARVYANSVLRTGARVSLRDAWRKA